MRHSLHREQSGDTIVEVLIAIVVIATVLTGGFLLSRNSLRSVRASEERSQALNLLQGQVEALRSAAGTGDLKDFRASGTKFCMDTSNKPQSYTAAACGGKGDGGFFDLSIVSRGIPAGDGTGNYLYLSTARWPSVDGGYDQIQLYYKVAVIAS